MLKLLRIFFNYFFVKLKIRKELPAKETVSGKAEIPWQPDLFKTE